MILSICSCGAEFIDDHDHGLCFGCKAKGVMFGSVRHGPSVQFLEKREIEEARSQGIEPERYSPVSPKARLDNDKKAERDLKRITGKLRSEVRNG